MLDREVLALLNAVRRRLWRGLFVTALRRALWGSAALVALATAVSLATSRTSVGALGIAVAVLWLLSLVWAASQRPADPECALWADRHLGGASAFTTLLDLEQGGAAQPDAAALQRLRVWATKNAPHCLRALIERQDPKRLTRPLLATTVCAALAALVLNLSDSMPAPVQQAAVSSPANVGDRAISGLGASQRDELASQIAKATRATDSGLTVERGEDRRTQETANGGSIDGGAPPDDRVMAIPAGAKPVSANAKSASRQMLAQSGTGQAAGTDTDADSGREAGNSVDRRAGMGTSYAPQGTITARRFQLEARQRPDEKQADMSRQGDYDEALTTVSQMTSPPVTAVAAAAPPTAIASSHMTTTESSYVQAWMKASAQRR